MCDRLRIVMNALTVLLKSNLTMRFMEKLVSSANRVFRAITKVGGLWGFGGRGLRVRGGGGGRVGSESGSGCNSFVLPRKWSTRPATQNGSRCFNSTIEE